MFRLLIRWLLQALALLITAWVVPGFRIASFPAALIAVVVIGLLNVTLGLALKVIAFPLAILTLGLLFLVINALILRMAGAVVPGFSVDTWGAAFAGALVLALLHLILRMVLE